MPNNDRILVTGATGGLGKQIIYQLLKEGHRPIALVRKSSNTEYIDTLGLEKRYADMRDSAALRASVNGVDVVIHTAAVVKFHATGLTQQTGINVMGALTLFKAAQEAGVRRFVHLSSIVAVGAIPRGNADQLIADESFEFNLGHLRVPYIMTKHSADVELLKAAETGNTELVIICLPLNVAPSRSGDDRTKAMRTLSKPVLPRFTNKLNFVDVRDSVKGITTAMHRGRHRERYLLCGENVALHDLVCMAAEITGKHPLLVPVPMWLAMGVSHVTKALHVVMGTSHLRFYPDLVRMAHYDWVYSSEKARRELGFTTRPFKETLTDLLTNNFHGTWLKPE
jgi:nucleoside-diphosphate-sugar epimerase